MITWDVAQWKENWKVEALAQGMAEGMERGMAEGELKNQRETLREILRNKFDQPLPEHLAGETNLERLRRLTTAAACADSMTAFAALAERERDADS